MGQQEQSLSSLPRVDPLLSHWKPVLLVGVIAGLAALLTSTLRPASYDAVAIIVATQPKYQLSFDSRIESIVNLQVPARAYAAIAQNGELLQGIIDRMGEQLPSSLRTVEALDAICSVIPADDLSVIQLAVRYRSPNLAAAIANDWADAFVRQINDVYGQTTSDVQQIDAQIRVAEDQLLAAEQALIVLKKTNRSRVLATTIESLSRSLSDYLAAESNLQLALQDALSLREQLATATASGPRLSSQLSALFTQLNALGATSDLAAQIQISLSEEVLEQASTDDQIRHLDSLIGAFKAKLAATAAAREEIPPLILQAQGEYQQAITELDRLQRAQDLARETYLALKSKAEELKIASQMGPSEVRLASPALPPARPSSPNRWLIAAVGAMVGLIIGGITAYAVELRNSLDHGSRAPS